MTRAVASRPAKRSGRAGDKASQSTPAPSSPIRGYLLHSQLPLTSLLFLLPLLIVYEVGTYRFAAQRVVAFEILHDFFNYLGARSVYLPALALISILMAWHIARRDPWDLHFKTAAGMVVESVALSLPLFVLNAVMVHYVPLRNFGPVSHQALKIELLLSVGAGIYEEMVFRLLAFTLLSLLLIDLLRFNKLCSYLLMVCMTAVMFAEYHYWRGFEVFNWRTFVFRTAAGIYFAVVFWIRGFGVTSGTHAAYDAILFAQSFLLTAQ